MQRNRRARGFTLIELMVVTAIVAILAIIAIPAFSAQIRKSRRAEAMTTLQDQQLRLERWRVDHADFSGYALPAGLSTAHYTFTKTATAALPNTYTLTAAPTVGQDSDECGTLSIVNTVGTITKTAATSNCW